MCHSNSKIFGLSWHLHRFDTWHYIDLTRGTIQMTCGIAYMTWPNGRLTCGSTDENWVVRMLTWQGDCAVQM
jgi:hypothetical protein